MAKLPQYARKNLALIRSMAPQIAIAAARYGVPAEAIAGSLAQEQSDQNASFVNEFKAAGSSAAADLFLAKIYAEGLATNPFDAQSGASNLILEKYNAAPNAITVGSDLWAKYYNGLLVDYGPAGMKFHNAIAAILNNPDDPAFAPYMKNLYAAGVALQNGSDPSLMASAMAAYLRQAVRVYQSNMRVNGDPATGINAWNSLSPSLQNALLVQFYKQGPTPNRVKKNMMVAAQNGVPYTPQIGADGAGATYLANEAAIKQALVAGATPPGSMTPAAFINSEFGSLDDSYNNAVPQQWSVGNQPGYLPGPTPLGSQRGGGSRTGLSSDVNQDTSALARGAQLPQWLGDLSADGPYYVNPAALPNPNPVTSAPQPNDLPNVLSPPVANTLSAPGPLWRTSTPIQYLDQTAAAQRSLDNEAFSASPNALPSDARYLVRVPSPQTSAPARPYQPGPPQQANSPPEGSQPLPFPVPPMVYGLPDPSVSASDNMDDWFDRWIKPLMSP